mgnify:CR=1 FL=1
MSADDFAPVVRDADPAEQAEEEERRRPVPGSPESRHKPLKGEHMRPGLEAAALRGEPSAGEMLSLIRNICRADMQPVLSQGGDLIGYHCARCGQTAGPDAKDDE